MKKLIYLILFFPSLAFAQVKSDAYLNTEADTIKNESVSGKNTQKRIARMFKNIIASKINKDSAAFTLTTTGTSGSPATYSAGVLNIPTPVTALPADASGFLKNNGSGTLSWDNSTIADAAWTTITLINGWASVSGNTVQYKSLGNGMIAVRGVLDGTSASSDQFTSGFPIPQGSSGNVNIEKAVIDINSNTLADLKINTAGYGFILSHGTDAYDLNGVIYTR